MKKKTSIQISILLAFFMIASTASFTTVADEPEGEWLEVEKLVKHNCQGPFVDEIVAEPGDWVVFKIYVAYHNPDFWVNQTVITDTLPSCLEYVETLSVEAPPGFDYDFTNIDNKTLMWDFGDDHLHDILDGEYIEIKFKAIVIDYGENINNVHVRVKKQCCEEYLEEEDTATVWSQGVEIEKLVYCPMTESWVDNLEQVTLGDIVKFKITITYHGPDIMKCMRVTDYLPTCCLEYVGNEEYTYPDPALFEDPVPEVSNGEILWNWDTILFNLYDEQSVIIQFDTNVTSYSERVVQNKAEVYLSSCLECPTFDGCDYAWVDCTQPDTNLMKHVLDGDTYADEADVIVNGTASFRLMLTYYGEENLTNINITDQLPDFLEFVSCETPDIQVETTDDNHFIWFNLTGVTLFDGDSFTIFYTVSVQETQETSGSNYAEVVDCELSDSATVYIVENNPPCCPLIQGDDNTAEVDEILTFKAKACEPDGDDLYFVIDWGDDETTETATVTPDTWLEDITHSWGAAGEYTIMIKAVDEHGAESEWQEASFPIIITDDGDEEPPEGENITIASIGGGFLKVTATIENIGEETVDVNWSIMIEGKLLSMKNTGANGTEAIADGDQVTVQCAPKLIGFGRVDITVEAEAGAYGSDSFSGTGFQLGPLMLFVKEA